MKFYIHYELSDPEFTLPVSVDSSSDKTVADMKSDFINAYNSRFTSNKLDPELFSLSLSKHKLLGLNDSIVSVVKPNSDVYLISRKADPKPKKAGEIKVAETKKPIPGVGSCSNKPANPLPTNPPSSQKKLEAAAPENKSALDVSHNEAKKKWTRPTPVNLSVPPQVTQVGFMQAINLIAPTVLLCSQTLVG
jgi:hypothetical protein